MYIHIWYLFCYECVEPTKIGSKPSLAGIGFLHVSIFFQRSPLHFFHFKNKQNPKCNVENTTRWTIFRDVEYKSGQAVDAVCSIILACRMPTFKALGEPDVEDSLGSHGLK